MYGLSNVASVTSEILQHIVFTENSYHSIVSEIVVPSQT